MIFEQIIYSNRPLLMNFLAEFREPWKMISTVLQEVKGAIGDTATIIKADADKSLKTARHFKVQDVPILVLF